MSSPACIAATRLPPRSTTALAARLEREVAQVGGEQDAGAAGAGVGDDLQGRVDAERVDAVEGLVEQQHGRLVERGQHDAEAGGSCRG